MPFNLKIQGFYFVITDTSTSSECIREKTAQVKFKVDGNIYKFFLDQKNNVGSPTSYQLGKDNEHFDYTDIIDNRTGLAFVTNAELTAFLSDKLGQPIGGGGGGVQSVTGDGVDNTDPANPVLSFPDADEVDDLATTKKFVRKLYINLDSAESSVTRATAGGRTIFTITHNFNTKDVLDRVYRISDDRRINWRIETPTVNTLEASRAGTVADGLFRILIIT